jgi:hypothetical protein
MSALCQKQTSRLEFSMSALHPKADMRLAALLIGSMRDVNFLTSRATNDHTYERNYGRIPPSCPACLRSQGTDR